MTTFVHDLRYAVRLLARSPGFTAVAVLTLALGIGATTALFSVVHAVLINPYPYARPGEIWTPGLRTAGSDQKMRPYRLDEYEQMARLPGLSETMATAPGSALLTGEFAPESIRAVALTGNAMQFLGVPPLLGRWIYPSDVRADGEAEPVVVLSYRRWQRLFGGDPAALGRTLRLDDAPYTIVGVMPPRFGWWTDDGVWLPLGTSARYTKSVFPLMRLAPGASLAAAKQQLHSLQTELAKINPGGFPREEFSTTLTNYLDITAASGEMQNSLRLLFGAVVFLLLIACANIANLQLARASSRGREMAIRLSIGARRGQLVRQLLTESVLVSLLGGLLGLLFASWITNLVVALMPSFYVPNEARIEVNRQVLLFCVVVSALTGVLFGLAPALQSTRADVADALKEDARGAGASTGAKLRALLVITEVATAVVLLVGAGLTVRSFVALRQVDLGFHPERVTVFGLPLPPKRYATWEQRNRFARELLDRVIHLPGVRAATIGVGGMPFGGPQSTFAIEGHVDGETRRVMVNLGAAGHLDTLGVPLRRGRMLEGREIDAAEHVAVINEAAAKLWPAGDDPLGRRVRLDLLERPGSPSVLAPAEPSALVTIVGVIGDTRNDDVRSEAQPAVIVPYTLLAPPQRTLAVRADVDPRSLVNAIRAQVREIDPGQPVNGPTSFDEILGDRTAQPRFTMALFSLFAALGLTLATAGIYSVLSYHVSRRTREIGVRMALGARRGDVLRLVFRAGGTLVGLGVLVGVVASLGAARVLTSQLDMFRVTGTDPVAFAGVIVLLFVVALAACFVPARRATRVDPMEALRYE